MFAVANRNLIGAFVGDGAGVGVVGLGAAVVGADVETVGAEVGLGVGLAVGFGVHASAANTSMRIPIVIIINQFLFII